MNDKGYTVIELLVVMLLSSLVAGVVFLTYGFINKNLASWKKNLYFEQEMEAKVKALDTQIRRIKTVEKIAGDTLYVKDKYGSERRLTLDGGEWMLKSVGGDSALEDVDFVGYRLTMAHNGRKMIIASGNRLLSKQ